MASNFLMAFQQGQGMARQRQQDALAGQQNNLNAFLQQQQEQRAQVQFQAQQQAAARQAQAQEQQRQQQAALQAARQAALQDFTSGVPGGVDGARLTLGRAGDLEGLNQLAELEAANAPKLQTVNRGDGGYDVNDMRTGNVVRSVNPFVDPLDQEYRQAQIEATRALVPQRQAAAANSRSVAANRGAGGASAPARINSDAQYNALPSGATFIAPDGTTRRKP